MELDESIEELMGLIRQIREARVNWSSARDRVRASETESSAANFEWRKADAELDRLRRNVLDLFDRGTE